MKSGSQVAVYSNSTGGRLGFHMFGALAEFERNLMRERTFYRQLNDTGSDVSLCINARSVRFQGEMVELGHWQASCPTERAIELARITSGSLAEDAFLHFDWTAPVGRQVGEHEYLLKRPREYDIGRPTITAETGVAADGTPQVTLSTDRPALWVKWDLGGDMIWSDNCLTLLPERPRVLRATRNRQSHLSDWPPEARSVK